MSLPRKAVAIDFLTKYEQSRGLDQTAKTKQIETGDTVSDLVRWANDNVAWIGKKMFRQQSENDIRNQIAAFKTQINNLDDFDSYKRLIFDLGDYANRAAENKFNTLQLARVTQKESLLCRTIHAIRSYIVEQAVLNPNSRFYDDFKALIADLQAKRAEYHDDIAAKRAEVLTNVDDKVQEREKLTIKLAYLCDSHAIDDVVTGKLLPRLVRHTNGAIPVLQRNYHKSFYNEKVREEKADTFEEYECKVADTVDKKSLEASVAHEGIFKSERMTNDGQVLSPDNPEVEETAHHLTSASPR